MEVTIIVKDGLVQEVYGTNDDIYINVIDLDTQDEDELEEKRNEAERVRSEQYYLW